MNHPHRDVERRFARNKDDAPPAPADHRWQVVPRQANSTHDIGFEKPLPIFVSYLAERLRFENPEIIHQNIGLTYAPYESGHAWSRGEIGGSALDFDLRHVLCKPLHRNVDALLSAAIKDYCGRLLRQGRAQWQTRCQRLTL